MDQRIDEMFSSTKLIFQTDEFGVYQGMLNMEELLESVSDSIEILVKEEMGDLGDEEEMFVNLMQEMLSSDEVKNELIGDIWNYHYYLGDIFTPDTLIYYTDEMENQLGGDKIPLEGVLTINTDREHLTIDIFDLKKIDRSAIKAVIADGAEQLNVASSEDITKMLDEQIFDVKDIENYTYDYDYGWLKYYERNRITSSENKRKENFIIMRSQ